MQIYNKKKECNAEYPIFKYLASTSFNFYNKLQGFRVPLYHIIFLDV